MNESALEDDDSDESQVAKYAYSIYSPMLLVLGLVGNVMSYVLIRRACPHSSLCIHLRVFVAAATLASYSYLLPCWLQHSMGVNAKAHSDASCKILVFVNYACGDVAMWVVVCMSLDRLVAVALPLHTKRWCTGRAAWRAASALLLCTLLKNFHLLASRGIVQGRCAPLASGPFARYERLVRPWISFLTAGLLPVGAILVLNVAIAVILSRHARAWAPSRGPDGAAERAASRREMSTVSLTVTVSVLYFVTVLPTFVLNLAKMATGYAYADVEAFTNLLLYSNYCLHFYIYCAVSPEYRRHSALLLLRGRAHLTQHAVLLKQSYLTSDRNRATRLATKEAQNNDQLSAADNSNAAKLSDQKVLSPSNE